MSTVEFSASGMMIARKPYPSDVSDDGWALVAPYLTLLLDSAKQPEHPLPEVFDGLRYIVKTGARAAWDGHKRTRGSKLHPAVDTMGHFLALHVTLANEGDRAAVRTLADAAQDTTGESVTLAYVNQGHAGGKAEAAAGAQGVQFEGCQVARRQARLRAAAPALDGRTQLRVDRALSQAVAGRFWPGGAELDVGQGHAAGYPFRDTRLDARLTQRMSPELAGDQWKLSGCEAATLGDHR